MIKLCKDCRHVRHEDKTCQNVDVGMWDIDSYDGTKRWLSPTTGVARTIGECGEEGKFWEKA